MKGIFFLFYIWIEKITITPVREYRVLTWVSKTICELLHLTGKYEYRLGFSPYSACVPVSEDMELPHHFRIKTRDIMPMS